MRRCRIFCFVIVVLIAVGREAVAGPPDSVRSRRWYLPHHLPVQFAGNIGLLSTGFGYSTKRQNYELNLLYGYVPASVGGHEIHMLTLKNIFPLSRFQGAGDQVLIPYLGIGLSAELGENAFFIQPSDYPESYYDFPKNLRVIGSLGLRSRHLFQDDFRFLRGIEFYAEAATVDVFVWYRLISDDIQFRKMFSVALGVNLLLDK